MSVRGLSGERGGLLVTALVVLAIVATAILLVLNAISAGAYAASVVDQHTAAANLARTQMEAIKVAPYQPYDPDNPPSYPTIEASGVLSMSVQIEYWDESSQSFVSSPPAGFTDTGLQRIVVSVYSTQMPGTPIFVLDSFKSNR